MSFQFQLEGLLRVRRLLEQQARERLDESMMRVRTLERRLEEARNWNERTAAQCALKSVLPAVELQFIDSVLCQTRQAIAQCERQKDIEDRRTSELRDAYLVARRARKTVETLRENAFRQFQTEQGRREQSHQDEMYLGKLLHSRRNLRQDSSKTGHEPNP